MSNSLTLITRKWAPLAKEYAKFLNINGIETVSIITDNTYYGYEISVFADEEDYLKISFENEKFNEQEKHINELLDTIESLSRALFDEDNEDDFGDLEDFEDEYKYIDDPDDTDDFY